MSDNESEVKMEIKPKKIKAKKEMTPERKEQLKAQLKKGRETSLRNRQKKMLVKKIDAKEKNEATDRKLARKLLNIEEEQVDQVKEQSSKEPVQEPVKQVKQVKEQSSKEPVKAESNHEVEELRNELKRLRDSMYEDFKAKEKEKEVLQPVKEVIQPVKEVLQPVKPVVKIYNAKQKGKKYNNRGFLSLMYTCEMCRFESNLLHRFFLKKTFLVVCLECFSKLREMSK